MVDHNNSPFLIWKNITMSESVEMYLVSIARIAESIGDESVPIPALAEVMNILPVSTNQMIRKLEETGLVHYLPYKGVQLTEAGQVIAEQVRRQHQLWEAFLVEYLKFPPQTADSLACRFEHIMSDAEVEHLAAFLAASGAAESVEELHLPAVATDPNPEFQLAQMTVDQSGYVTRVTGDQAQASFLSAAGVRPGIRITTIARADSGDMLVRADDCGRIHLSPELAGLIWLRKVEI